LSRIAERRLPARDEKQTAAQPNDAIFPAASRPGGESLVLKAEGELPFIRSSNDRRASNPIRIRPVRRQVQEHRARIARRISPAARTIQDIMRKDAGIYGDAQRLEQMR
jgi:hypothetical protein